MLFTWLSFLVIVSESQAWCHFLSTKKKKTKNKQTRKNSRWPSAIHTWLAWEAALGECSAAPVASCTVISDTHRRWHKSPSQEGCRAQLQTITSWDPLQEALAREPPVSSPNLTKGNQTTPKQRHQNTCASKATRKSWARWCKGRQISASPGLAWSTQWFPSQRRLGCETLYQSTNQNYLTVACWTTGKIRDEWVKTSSHPHCSSTALPYMQSVLLS